MSEEKKIKLISGDNKEFLVRVSVLNQSKKLAELLNSTDNQVTFQYFFY
jgi:hypothetical protein